MTTSPSSGFRRPDGTCAFCPGTVNHTDLCPQAFRDALPVTCFECGKDLATPMASGEHECPAERRAPAGVVS